MGHLVADAPPETVEMPEVRHVNRVHLPIDRTPIRWERDNADAIAAHWETAIAERPTMFNGVVYCTTSVRMDTASVSATAHPMQFAGLTYWRHLGMPPVGFHSVFGDIVLRGSDGGLIMARTSAHTATGGMLGFPGGTFDDDDVTEDGLDPSSCILRECAEETGWQASELDLQSGYLVYLDQSRLAITAIGDMGVQAAEGAARIRATLDKQDQPELSEIYVVGAQADLDRIGPHPYSRVLADWIFENG